MTPIGKIAICETLAKSIIRTQSKLVKLEDQLQRLENTIRSAQTAARKERNQALADYLRVSLDLIAVTYAPLFAAKNSIRGARSIGYIFTGVEIVSVLQSFKKVYAHIKQAQKSNRVVALAIRQTDTVLDEA